MFLELFYPNMQVLVEFENIKEYKKSDYRALYNILEKSKSHKFSL